MAGPLAFPLPAAEKSIYAFENCCSSIKDLVEINLLTVLAKPAVSGNRAPVAPVGSGPAGEFSGLVPVC
jgi:hypothetical protein